MVPPISKVVADSSPATVAIPDAKVRRSVSDVCPIVLLFISILSITARVTALLVPKVTASIAPPFTSAVAITVEPVKVTLPSAKVIRSLSEVWPIVAPSILILSIIARVTALFVPSVTASIAPPLISALLVVMVELV